VRRAALTTLAVTALFIAYVELIAPLVQRSEPALALLVAVLLLSGVAIYSGCRQSRWLIAWLVIAAVVVPLPPLLYLGGDPAKPGLEYLLYFAEVVVIVVAEVLAWLLDRLIRRRRQVNAEA
jgi:hypothetical protein